MFWPSSFAETAAGSLSRGNGTYSVIYERRLGRMLHHEAAGTEPHLNLRRGGLVALHCAVVTH